MKKITYVRNRRTRLALATRRVCLPRLHRHIFTAAAASAARYGDAIVDAVTGKLYIKDHHGLTELATAIPERKPMPGQIDVDYVELYRKHGEGLRDYQLESLEALALPVQAAVDATARQLKHIVDRSMHFSASPRGEFTPPSRRQDAVYPPVTLTKDEAAVYGNVLSIMEEMEPGIIKETSPPLEARFTQKQIVDRLGFLPSLSPEELRKQFAKDIHEFIRRPDPTKLVVAEPPIGIDAPRFLEETKGLDSRMRTIFESQGSMQKLGPMMAYTVGLAAAMASPVSADTLEQLLGIMGLQETPEEKERREELLKHLEPLDWEFGDFDVEEMKKAVKDSRKTIVFDSMPDELFKDDKKE